METTMGKVLVTAKIENLDDLFSVHKGLLQPEQVRCVEVTDALVDTGATALSLPKRLIDQLGLHPFRTRPARSSGGPITLQIYGSVRLTVQGRDWNGDVAELPDDCPVRRRSAESAADRQSCPRRRTNAGIVLNAVVDRVAPFAHFLDLCLISV
jgi:hypothetical protein